MKLPFQKLLLPVLLATAILLPPVAFGDAIRFDFGPVGATALTAVFDDAGPNEVELTITGLALSGDNSVQSLCFNFNPGFDARNLMFTQTSQIGGVQVSVKTGNDSYKVSGGSGKFDIDLLFDPFTTFKTGDMVTYCITGISGLSLNDFLFLDTPSAGWLPTYAASSLQESSGIVTIEGTPRAAPDAMSTFGVLAVSIVIVKLLTQHLRSLPETDHEPE